MYLILNVNVADCFRLAQSLSNSIKYDPKQLEEVLSDPVSVLRMISDFTKRIDTVRTVLNEPTKSAEG